MHACIPFPGTVFSESTIIADNRLKFNFKTSENKTAIEPDKVSGRSQFNTNIYRS
jgi:hypothetical protein